MTEPQETLSLPPVVQARRFTIAVASSRFATTWKNTRITWSQLLGRISSTRRTPETISDYRELSKHDQDQIKDVGGFVGGELREGVRKKDHVNARSLLSLDIDFANGMQIWDEITLLEDYTAILYSTHKHTPEQPRLRLLILLSRDVTPEEYEAVARRLADRYGIDQFDDTTFEPHRLMYWPSTSADGEYIFQHQEGTLLDPDEILAEYNGDWRDTTTWPTSSRVHKQIQASARKQADPLTKPGLVGAFNRAYSISEAIEQWLDDVYTQSAHDGRYDYRLGESSAGLVVYDDKFAYSHHATDPAGGQLCNAFDLVRIHRYGGEDPADTSELKTTELPSYKAMCDWARALPEVKTQITKDMLTAAQAEFDELPSDDTATDGLWMSDLEITRGGKLTESLTNHVLVLRNDPALQAIAWNEHRDGLDVRGELPWEHLKIGFTDTDWAQLKIYLQKTYGLYAPPKTKDAVLAVASERSYNPVKDYLEALPPWDGVARIDTLLQDYLGAEDSIYTREVMRKTLVAAVRRIYEPGVKFDYMLILNGPQGTGKSTLIAKLGGSWFSDALTLTDMRDKAAAEKLQGYWVLEISELAGMRKTDVEVIKSFISRQDDKYRQAYGIQVEAHPRHCVFMGTTNSELGFLRDTTGNRRFLPIPVTGDCQKHPWDLTDADINQIWAEAKHREQAGETLYLSREASVIATTQQEQAMETDEREGLIIKYLETLLPVNWADMSLYDRRDYLNGGGLTIGDETTLEERLEVSNIEIWAECLGKDPTLMKASDSYQISAMITKIEGWRRPKGKQSRRHLPIYGRQRVWVRSTK